MIQSKAAELDPYGMSTENGFITSDGQEFIVTLDGKLVKVEDGEVDDAFNEEQIVARVFLTAVLALELKSRLFLAMGTIPM